MRRIRVATLPDAKAGPRPTGSTSRENLENRHCERRQMTTTEQRRLVRSQQHRQMWETAAGAYREGDAESNSRHRVSSTWPSVLLEPCAVKVARTVLRGLGAGDRVWLPDYAASRNVTIDIPYVI